MMSRRTSATHRDAARFTIFAIATAVAALACNPSAASPAVAMSPSPVTPTGAVTRSATPAVAADWPGFRGDSSRSGIGDAGPVGNPVLDWRYQAKAAVPNDVAIVGDCVFFASDDGSVYALDLATGEERWVVKVPHAPLMGPVAGDGRLHFLGGDGTVRAIDAADGHTLWTSAKIYDGPSQMIIDDGTLYFGTGDGFVVALDGATGAEVWRLQPSPSTTTVDSPAIVNGLLYAGTDGGGFVAIDTTTHEVTWTGDTAGEDTGTASATDGFAFIGAFIDAPAGELRAFDAVTGQLRWTGPGPRLGIPAIADGLAFSATPAGVITAMDLETGAMRWTIQVDGAVRPMATSGHILYVPVDEEHRVYAIDTISGGELWHFDVDGRNDCCVAVTGGRVYVGTMSGSVYAIGGDGAAIVPRPFATPEPTATPAPSGGPVADLAPEVSWSSALDGAAIAPISQLAVAPDGRVWVPEAESGRIAILGPDGALVEHWGDPGTGEGQFDFTRANGDGYGTLAFAPDGSFYVLDAGNRRIQHFDADRTFVNAWGSFGSGPGQFNDPVGLAVGADGTVWVLDNLRNVIEHYAPDGTVLGSVDPFAARPVNDGANSLAIDPAGNLYVSLASPSSIAVFDPAGTFVRFVGQGAFDEQATHMAIDAAGRLFVTQGPQRGDAPGVLVFGPDGTLLGGFGPLGTDDGELVFPAGIALDGGGVYVEDSEPGSARLVRYELPDSLR
jgi:outer membrane protein assembly factor BamB